MPSAMQSEPFAVRPIVKYCKLSQCCQLTSIFISNELSVSIKRITRRREKLRQCLYVCWEDISHKFFSDQ